MLSNASQLPAEGPPEGSSGAPQLAGIGCCNDSSGGCSLGIRIGPGVETGCGIDVTFPPASNAGGSGAAFDGVNVGAGAPPLNPRPEPEPEPRAEPEPGPAQKPGSR